MQLPVHTIKVSNGLPREIRLVMLQGFIWNIIQLTVLFRNNSFCLWHNGENVACLIKTTHTGLTILYPPWRSDVMRGHRFRSSLYQERVCCLTAQNNFLIQCRFVADKIAMTNFNFSSFAVIMIVLLIRNIFKWVFSGPERALKQHDWTCLAVTMEVMLWGQHKIRAEGDVHIPGTVAQSTQITDVLFYCPLVDVAAILNKLS